MSPTFEATQAAIEHYDAVDQPALDAMRGNNGTSLNLSGFTQARKIAADRVRAAYLEDTRHFNTAELVELMSVDRIRRSMGGTFLGKLLGFLP